MRFYKLQKVTMKKSQKNVGLVFHLACYITDHSIKTVFGFFRILGALIRGGRLFNLNLYFGGRLFKGGAYSKEGA